MAKESFSRFRNPRDVEVDQNENIIVAADSAGNFMTTHINSSGSREWTTGYIMAGNDITLQNSNSMICTGSKTISSQTDAFVVKFSNIMSAITFNGAEIPVQFNLSQNYPNPFNPMTKIKFDIPKAFTTKLAVYDILGKEVAVLVDDNLKPGSYEVDFNAANLPSGTYFYRLITDGFSETKKMTLIK